MNEKTDVHIVWRANGNVHVGFFHSYLKETKKKSTVNFYNLISYHFHTKSKGKHHTRGSGWGLLIRE